MTKLSKALKVGSTQDPSTAVNMNRTRVVFDTCNKLVDQSQNI